MTKLLEAALRLAKATKDLVSPTIPSDTLAAEQGADHTRAMLREVIDRMGHA